LIEKCNRSEVLFITSKEKQFMDIKVELLFCDRGNVIASDVLRGKPEREKPKCSAIRNLVSAAPQKWAGLVDAGTNRPPP
jgi:hypothetical protein